MNPCYHCQQASLLGDEDKHLVNMNEPEFVWATAKAVALGGVLVPALFVLGLGFLGLVAAGAKALSA